MSNDLRTTRVLGRTLARVLEEKDIARVGGGHGSSCPGGYFLTYISPDFTPCDPPGTQQP